MATGIYILPTIPDNEGRTAFSVLRRLGVGLTRLERAVLLVCENHVDQQAAAESVRADESIFNANIHALQVADLQKPAAGEVWVESDIPDIVQIEGLGNVRRLTAWGIHGSAGAAEPAIVEQALQLLLCNPAVQHVVEQM
jgi:hypothetical protein